MFTYFTHVPVQGLHVDVHEHVPYIPVGTLYMLMFMFISAHVYVPENITYGTGTLYNVHVDVYEKVTNFVHVHIHVHVHVFLFMFMFGLGV